MSTSARKIIHFVRHAEGEHNVAQLVSGGNLREDLEDASLTDLGNRQCRALHDRIFQWSEPAAADELGYPNGEYTSERHPYHPARAQLLVVSPLNRALATATQSFELLKDKIPWVALECIRETTGLHPCDRRKHIDEHKESFPHVRFDLISEPSDTLYLQFITRREPMENVVTRGNEFIEWLKIRPENNIVVVTHSSFLKYFFIGCAGVPEDEFVWFENCELRSYHYDLDGVIPCFEPVGHDCIIADNL